MQTIYSYDHHNDFKYEKTKKEDDFYKKC